MSGDMFTSLGNGFTNICLMSYCLHRQYPSLQLPQIHGMIEGDDGLFAVPMDCDTEQIKVDVSQLGFELEARVVHDLNEASFCGTVFDAESHIMMTEPIYTLLNSGWSFESDELPFCKRVLLTYAKGASMCCEYRDCPILHCWGLHLIRTAESYGIEWKTLVDKHQTIREMSGYYYSRLGEFVCSMMPRHSGTLLSKRIGEAKIPMSARSLFENLYKIPITVQLAIEQKMSLTLGWVDLPELNNLIPQHARVNWCGENSNEFLSIQGSTGSWHPITDVVGGLQTFNHLF